MTYSSALAKADNNDFPEALDITEKALKNSSTATQCRYEFLVLKASLIRGRDWRGALELLEASPPSDLEKSDVAVRRLLAQGLSYASGKKFVESAAALHEAEKAAKLYAHELPGRVTWAQGYLADLQSHTDEAERHYRAALQFALEHQQTALEGDIRVNLGRILASRERYSEALEQLQRALEIVHTEKTKEKTLGNLGWSYSQLGELDQAISLLRKAEEIAARIEERYDRFDWVTQLGTAYLAKREYDDADKYYKSSLQIAKELGKSEKTALAFHNLAQLEILRNHLDKAEEYNRQAYLAEGLSPADLSDPYLVLTTAEIAHARSDLEAAKRLLPKVIENPNSDSSLRWQAHSDLANCYADSKDASAAETEFDKGVRLVEEATQTVGQEERRMSILDAWPFYDDYIKFLIDQNNAKKALQIAEFSRARTLADAFGLKGPKKATGLQVPAIQGYLRDHNRVILAYWLSEKESYLWAITPSQLKLFHLPPKAQIEALVRQNLRQITDERAAVGESGAARSLYDILVRPAEKLIAQNAHLIIVPHRGLYSLNFETLVPSEPELHYWVKDVTLENASSIALLVNSARPRRQCKRDLLLIGAPVQAVSEFPALKNADAELRQVKARFPATAENVISGAAASPSAYSAARPQNYRFIHFVTHGIPNQLVPLDSAVVLSPDGDKQYKLYAREIKNISEKRLLNAELVTISACYSAGNKTYAGEGLVGLAWAFMRAGAHQVIGSLWEVDDEATPAFMGNMYGEIRKGGNAADALRAAKLKMLGSSDLRHREPYYWASLQLYTGP